MRALLKQCLAHSLQKRAWMLQSHDEHDMIGIPSQIDKCVQINESH